MVPVQNFCCKRTNLTNPKRILSWKVLCCIVENWAFKSPFGCRYTWDWYHTVQLCSYSTVWGWFSFFFPFKYFHFIPGTKWEIFWNLIICQYGKTFFPQEKVCKALLFWTGTVFQRGPQSPLLSSIWQASVRFRSHSAEPWSCNASLMLFKAISHKLLVHCL